MYVGHWMLLLLNACFSHADWLLVHIHIQWPVVLALWLEDLQSQSVAQVCVFYFFMAWPQGGWFHSFQNLTPLFFTKNAAGISLKPSRICIIFTFKFTQTINSSLPTITHPSQPTNQSLPTPPNPSFHPSLVTPHTTPRWWFGTQARTLGSSNSNLATIRPPSRFKTIKLTWKVIRWGLKSRYQGSSHMTSELIMKDPGWGVVSRGQKITPR